MTLMILGLVLFIGLHCTRIVAPAVRENAIAKIGLGPWKGIYSLVSLAGLAAIIWGYGIARTESDVLYVLPDGTVHFAMLLMLVSLILAVASDLPVGRIRQTVKHPLLIGTKTWAIAHLLVNGDVASLILFGSIFIWAVIAVIAIKRRGEPAPVANSRWSDLAAVVIGTALWAAIIFWLHTWLIGVPVIA